MTTKQLTATQKVKYLAIITERDGDVCFYCKMPFVPQVPKWSLEFDHLNCNREDNRIENLVITHQECNQKKKYDSDMQILAREKLKENENSGSLGEGEEERKSVIHTETNMEIDSNIEFARITEEFLTERLKSRQGKLPAETELDSKETMDTIAYLCRKETGHGSQNTIRRIIDEFCCPLGDFEKIKKKGRFVIRLRNGK